MKLRGVYWTHPVRWSVRPSVHPSVHPSHLFDNVSVMVSFWSRFRTVTPVWIQIRWWNDAQSFMLLRRGALLFLAATKQLNEWYFPSVCLSVCYTFLTMFPSSYHQFSGVITNDRSDVHAKSQGQRSKVKVTEVNTQLSHFQTVTPVWIHIWWWNDAQSLMLLRRGALLFFKVIHQISRSEGSKNRRIWPKLAFPDCNSSLNSPMATKWCTKLEVAYKRCPIGFQAHLSNFKVTGL